MALGSAGWLGALVLLVAARAACADPTPSRWGGRWRSMDLSRRAIKRLDQIPTLPFAEFLNVSYNLVQSWGDHPFQDYKALRRLDLSHNMLTHVDAEALAEISWLRVLNMSFNAIAHLDPNAFPAMPSLQDLDLSHNGLETVHDVAFANLGGLVHLDLSGNLLHALGALQGLPALSELSLAGNPTAGDLVLGGPRLERVDFSRAGLKTIPAALTRSVRTLVLVGNNLRALRCGDLDSFPLLRTLDASQCDLAAVEDDALGRLEQLEVLVFSENQLTVVPHSLPASLTSLRLDRNNISSLETGDFQGLRRLRELDLRTNRLASIQDGALRPLALLEVLDLSDNALLELPSGALVGPRALRALYLANLRALPRAAWLPFPLQSPEHLQVLDLTLSPALARQLLGDQAALAALQQLQVLRLSGAGLRQLPPELPQLLSHLHQLHLAANPLACDHLAWLAVWLRALAGQDKATCAEPERLSGRPLSGLQEADFTGDKKQSRAEDPAPAALPGSDLSLLEGHVELEDPTPARDFTWGMSSSPPPATTTYAATTWPSPIANITSPPVTKPSASTAPHSSGLPSTSTSAPAPSTRTISTTPTVSASPTEASDKSTPTLAIMTTTEATSTTPSSSTMSTTKPMLTMSTTPKLSSTLSTSTSLPRHASTSSNNRISTSSSSVSQRAESPTSSPPPPHAPSTRQSTITPTRSSTSSYPPSSSSTDSPRSSPQPPTTSPKPPSLPPRSSSPPAPASTVTPTSPSARNTTLPALSASQTPPFATSSTPRSPMARTSTPMSSKPPLSSPASLPASLPPSLRLSGSPGLRAPPQTTVGAGGHSVLAMFGLAGLGAVVMLLVLSWRRRQGLLRPPSMEDLVLRTAEAPELW